MNPSIVQAKWVAYRKCSKCGGKVFMDKDEFGHYLKCLNCAKEINVLMPETKAEWDALVKYLNGNYGRDLPADCKSPNYKERKHEAWDVEELDGVGDE